MVLLLAMSWFYVGCSKPPPPPDGQLHIENVSKWYQLYRAEHKGKPPSNEEKFIAFINQNLADRGESVEADFLTSPRDGEKYEISYGKATNENPEKNVAVYEKTGYDEKKLMAIEGGYSYELTQAELEAEINGTADQAP